MSKFPFFPIPADGESIYSVFCRCAERSGLPDQYILLWFTGQKYKATLLAALPGYLQKLSLALPSGHPWIDLGHTIQHHTSLPYFTYFDTPEKRDSAVKLLSESAHSKKVFLSLGLSQYRCAVAPKHPRFCSACIQEDERTLGFPYFHREHQLPGVAVCWKHDEILSHGCYICGTYPIRGWGLSMPGRCKCSSELSPMPAFEKLPADHAVLKWLADESAQLVNAVGTTAASPRATLRQLAFTNGFCKGSLPDYSRIATAIEQKYGAETLQWLGIPARSNGCPSSWIYKLLYDNLTNKKRSPSILFLLFVGLFYESILEFEAAIFTNQPGNLSQAKDAMTAPAPTLVHHHVNAENTATPAWANDLQGLLAKHSFCLSAAAAHAGISAYVLAVQARNQGIRVPLSKQISTKLGQNKLEKIRNDLRKGMPKKTVHIKYGVSYWAILLIELDMLEIAKINRSVRANSIRDTHRQKIIDLIKSDLSVSRTTVLVQLPGTYEYVLQKDRDWFDQQFPLRRKPSQKAEKHMRVDRTKLDKALAIELQHLITTLMSSSSKPVRITKSGMLKRAGHFSKYQYNPGAYPETTSLLKKFTESQYNFINRKITWAIGEIIKSGQTISINTLRRKASVQASKLRERREFVIKVAQDYGATIHMQSFFANEHT